MCVDHRLPGCGQRRAGHPVTAATPISSVRNRGMSSTYQFRRVRLRHVPDHVDEPRRYNEPPRVDHSAASERPATDGPDDSGANTDVRNGVEARLRVYHAAVADDDVVDNRFDRSVFRRLRRPARARSRKAGGERGDPGLQSGVPARGAPPKKFWKRMTLVVAVSELSMTNSWPSGAMSYWATRALVARSEGVGRSHREVGPEPRWLSLLAYWGARAQSRPTLSRCGGKHGPATGPMRSPPVPGQTGA